MSLCVRGALNWNKKLLNKLFKDEKGKFVSANEAKDHLMDLLSEGYEMIPIGKECDQFDKKKGCKGHRK